MNYSLFPTLVTHTENFLSKREIREIKKAINKCNYLKDNVAFMGDAKSTHTREYKTNDKLKEFFDFKMDLRSRIEQKLEEYCITAGSRMVQIDEMWCNVQKEGSTLLNHIHGGSVLSAALYIHADDDSSRIYFENPNQLALYSLYGQGTVTEYNCEVYGFVPLPGDLYIFPSWMKHGSSLTKNKTDERMVISVTATYR